MEINGVQIDPAYLYTKEEALETLGEGGCTDRALSEIRNEYEARFGHDIIWRYPIMVGMDQGVGLIPVQEGFLSIGYDEMTPDDYEIYDLEKVVLLSSAELDHMIEVWDEFATDLSSAMGCMRNIQYKLENT